MLASKPKALLFHFVWVRMAASSVKRHYLQETRQMNDRGLPLLANYHA
jgi:hypothetical protein